MIDYFKSGKSMQGIFRTGFSSWMVSVTIMFLTVFVVPHKASGQTWNGAGTNVSPWEIVTQQDLDDLVTWVNSGNTGAGTYFILVDDIALTGLSGAGWLPIGTFTNPFSGNFDGNGKVISGLWANRPSENYVGLFGYLNGATIHDLSVVVDALGIIGNDGVGGLAGGSYQAAGGSTFTNCRVTGGKISGAFAGGFIGDSEKNTFTKCSAANKVEGHQVGGFVGSSNNNEVYTNCYATGDIHVIPKGGTYAYPFGGGFVGHGRSGGASEGPTLTMSGCYATGNLTGDANSFSIGGFAGQLHGGNGTGFTSTITNCYALGSVTGPDKVGGFVGSLMGGTGSLIIIENCYSAGAVSASTTVVGGFFGNAYSPSIPTFTNCFFDKTVNSTFTGSTGITAETTANMMLKTTYQNWDLANTWFVCNNYPILKWQDEYTDPVTYLTAFTNGDGSNSNPYQIENEVQLKALSDYVNNCGSTANMYFKLANDINISSYNWTPIGLETNGFEGDFNGNNMTISGLWINNPSLDIVGLFGTLDGATVYNLNVEIDTIKNIIGGGYTGGFVGYAYNAAITNCTVKGGYVKGTVVVGGFVSLPWECTITDCYSTSNVIGVRNVGGFAGQIYLGGTYKKCYATGDVTASDLTNSYAGGFVGIAWYKFDIIECFAKGNVTGTGIVGGFSGHLNVASSYGITGAPGNVQDCYATGKVVGTKTIGGFSGATQGTDISITNCYAAGVVANATNAGGFIGDRYNVCTFTNCFYDKLNAPFNAIGNTAGVISGITGNTTAQMQTASTFSGAGWDLTNTWFACNDYPIFQWQDEYIDPATLLTLTGTPYQINNAADLAVLANYVYNCGSTAGMSFILMNDIDLSTINLQPIGTSGNPFAGEFNGNGYKITNLAINRPTEEYVGLFGYVNNATIKDLSIEIDAAGIIGGSIPSDLVREYEGGVGALSGMAENTVITNCSVTGNVTGLGQNIGGLVGLAINCTITDCSADGKVSGDGVCVGGLAGYLYKGSIANSTSSGEVFGNEDSFYTLAGGFAGAVDECDLLNCSTTSDVTGYSYVGGLMGGFSNGSAENCFTTGKVYSFGIASTVHPYEMTGGFTAFAMSANIKNCYSSSNVEGNQHVGGFIGSMNIEVVVENCYAIGDVKGVGQVGGFAGNIQGSSASNIIHCYSSGVVSGTTDFGGFIGYSNLDHVDKCYFDAEVNSGLDGVANGNGKPAIDASGELVGKTTSEMKQEATFTNWDFTTAWGICEAMTYPFLQLQNINCLDLLTLTAENITVTATQQAADVTLITGLTPGANYSGLKLEIAIDGNPALTNVTHSVLGTISFAYNSGTNKTVATISNYTYTEFDVVLATLTAANTGTYPYTVTLYDGSDNELTSSSATITVDALVPTVADLVVTPSLPTNLTYNGNSQGVVVSPKTGLTGFGTIDTIYYKGINGTTYGPSITAPTNAGEYEVSVSISAGTSYAAITGLVVGTYTIDPATPAVTDLDITPALPTSFTYNGNPQGITITPKVSLSGFGTTVTINYKGINGTVYNPSVTAPTNAGEYEVSVDISAGTNYTAITGLVVGSYTINPKTLVATDFTYSPTSVVYNGLVQVPSVALTISTPWAITDTFVVMYDGVKANATYPVNANSYTLTVDITHSTNYQGTGIALGTYEITKAAPVDTVLTYTIPQNHIYNGTAQGIGTVSAKAGINGLGTTITVYYEGIGGTNYTRSTTSPTDAGTYDVYVTISAGTNYLATTGTGLYLGVYTIGKKTPTMSDVALNPTSNVYNGNPQGTTPTVASGFSGLGTITATMYNGSLTVPTNAGTYAITVNIAAGNNYTAISGLYVGLYNITPKATTAAELTFSPTSKVYNGNPQPVVITAASGVVGLGMVSNVRYEGVAPTTYPQSTTAPTNVGNYSITVDIGVGLNYDAATSITLNGNYSITAKTPTLADLSYSIPQNHIYNGSPQGIGNVTMAAGVNGLGTPTVYYEGISPTSYPISTTAPTNAGSYTVTVTISAGTNYTAITTPGLTLGTYTIGKKMPTASDLTFTPSSNVYNGNPQGVTVNVAGGLSGFGSVSATMYNGSTTVPTNVGTYSITVNVVAGTNYDAITSLYLGTYQITQKTPIASDFVFTPSSTIYNGSPQPITVTTASGIVGLGAVTAIMYNGSTTVPTNVGTYTITVNVTAGINYNAATSLSLGTYQITSKTLLASDFTFTPSSNVYNGSPQAVTVTAASGMVGLGTVTAIMYNGSTTIPDNVGTYTITINVSAGSNYAAATALNLGTYSITKAIPALTDLNHNFQSANFVYNGLPQGTVTVTPKSNIKGMGGISVDYNGLSAAIDANTYTVTVTIAAGSNYEAKTLVLGTFTIDKRKLTIADLDSTAMTVMYNGSPQGVSITAKASVPNFDGNIIVKYNGDMQEPTNAGTYTVTVTIEEGNNYAAVAEFYFGDFIITQDGITEADLVYTIPTNHIYNGLQQGIGTVTCSITDFDGDIIIMYNGSEELPVNAGDYLVTVKLISVNYNAEVTLGTYTIGKATVTVKADDHTITKGATLPLPTLTYTGFIGTDSEDNALSVKAKAQLNVQNSDVEGTSVIDFAVQAVLNTTNGANYVLVHENGELIITSVGIGEYNPQANPLKAYVNNGTLYVSGLTAGKVWSVYTTTGALIYQSTANSDTAETYLSVRGLYIIQSGNKTVKVAY